MANKIRVGILGGTFNPIHKGHVQLGLHIQNAFKLDKVLYILSAHPPHKKNIDIAPATIRWEMLTHALKPFPSLIPCDIEMKRPQDSWTIDTIAELKLLYPHYQFYFISGSEGFLKIRTWKNYQQLFHMLSFIVLLREPTHLAEVTALLHQENITPFEVDNLVPTLSEELPMVYLFSYQSDTLMISSTLIRQKRQATELIDQYVPEEVKHIMEENKLYETRGL